jgi:hypothetical protein
MRGHKSKINDMGHKGHANNWILFEELKFTEELQQPTM